MYSKKLFLTSLIILLFVLILRFYGYAIYTYSWHQMNPDPIIWGDLEIAVPNELIAEIIKNERGNEELEIKLLENQKQVTIYFLKETRHKKDGFNLESMFLSKGYQIIEKNSCSISGQPCVWIKAHRKLKEVNYLEDIYFPAKKFHATFFGHVHQRKYFLDIVGNLKFS